MLNLISNESWSIGLKLRPSWWCLWYFSSEAGLSVLQVGGLIVEWYN